MSLCYRCEYRIKYIEDTYKKEVLKEEVHPHAPRMECSSIESAVSGCYMFKPCKPITLVPRDGDARPLTLNIFSCRVERGEDVELELAGKIIDNQQLVYWKPKTKETWMMKLKNKLGKIILRLRMKTVSGYWLKGLTKLLVK